MASRSVFGGSGAVGIWESGLSISRFPAVHINDKWGFIDKSGRYVIAPIYLNVTDFSDGRAAVNIIDGDWFLIDKSGKRLSNTSWGISEITLLEQFCPVALRGAYRTGVETSENS